MYLSSGNVTEKLERELGVGSRLEWSDRIFVLGRTSRNDIGIYVGHAGFGRSLFQFGAGEKADQKLLFVFAAFKFVVDETNSVQCCCDMIRLNEVTVD